MSLEEGDNMKNSTPRLRTIPKTLEEIKRVDPDSALTLRALRKMVNQGIIPTVSIGTKRLINLNELMDILSLKCYNNSTIRASYDERST